MTRIPDFELRKATQAEIPAILAFIHEFAQYVEKPDTVTATRETLENDLFGEARKARVILGYHRGEPVSYALYYFTYSSFRACPELYLEDLYVVPHYRGRGIGKATLKYLANTANEHECRQFHWLARKGDASALAFYASIGAVQDTETIAHSLNGDSLQDFAGRS